jgi:S-adenosyl-L-methionine hydrolase (adenosine-forming)
VALVTLVTLLSDFGTRDTYAGVMEGAILCVAPDARVLHLTHGVPAGDIPGGARALADAVVHVPRGIHVAVVDPGVGTDRRALVLEAGDGRLFVGPDNGLLAPAADRCGGVVAAHELVVPSDAAPTFHGRDVFAPAAGRLARGDPASALGGSIETEGLVRLALPRPSVDAGALRAPCAHVDRFGNSALAATADDLDGAGLVVGSAVAVAVRGLPRGAARRGRTFADVPPGALVVLVDSAGAAAVCINGGDAATELRIAVGDDIELRLPVD